MEASSTFGVEGGGCLGGGAPCFFNGTRCEGTSSSFGFGAGTSGRRGEDWQVALDFGYAVVDVFFFKSGAVVLLSDSEARNAWWREFLLLEELELDLLLLELLSDLLLDLLPERRRLMPPERLGFILLE